MVLPETVRLEPGDIVLVASDGFVAWAIRRFRSRCEEPTYVNHVALIVNTVGPDDWRSAEIDAICVPGAWERLRTRPWAQAILIDAQPPRVARRSLADYRGQLVAVYRPRLPISLRQRIAARAARFEGKWYGLSKIFLHLFGLAGLSRFDRYPICSWVVAKPFQEEGLSFGVDAGGARPDDVWDFCRTRPDAYECVMPLGILE